MVTELVSIGRGLGYPPRQAWGRKNATAMWRAADPAGDQYLRDITGNGHDARFGSVGTARVMGPVNGKDGYFRLPGDSGNYAESPWHEDFDIENEIDIRALIHLPASGAIVGREVNTVQNPYYLAIVDNRIMLSLGSGNSGTRIRRSSTDELPNERILWVRATWRISDGRVQFFTSGDGVVWAQLGDDQNNPTELLGTSQNLPMYIGGLRMTTSPSQVFQGKILKIQVLDGIDGSLAFDVDFTNLEDGTEEFTENTGKTVTVHSAGGDDTNDPLHLDYDGEKYLSLPGTSGNYASTPDVNLLDANTAHFEQSRGIWSWQSQTSISIDSSRSYFGNNSLRCWISGSSTTIQPRMISPADGISVGPGDTITMSLFVYTEKDGQEGQLRYRFWDDEGNTVLSADFGDSTELEQNQWSMIDYTSEVPAGATRVGWWIYVTNAGPGDECWIDAVCLKTDSEDPTFVPSHRIVGDFEARARFSPHTWRPNSPMGVFNAFGLLRIAEDGRFRFHYDYDGGSAQIDSGAVPETWGEEEIRVIARQEDQVIFQRHFEGEWVTINSRDLPHHILLRPLHVAGSSSWPFHGNFYSFELRDGVDGPVVARFEPANFEEPHITAPGGVGEEWRIHRSGSGRKSVLVDRPILLFGTDDYLEVPHHDDLNSFISEDFSVIGVWRIYNPNNANQGAVISKRHSSVGWDMRVNNGTLNSLIMDGSWDTRSVSIDDNYDDGVLLTSMQRISGDSHELLLNQNVSTVGTRVDGDTSNNGAVYIGKRDNNYLDFEFIGAAIFKGKALTDLELSWVAKELMAK